MSIKANQLRSLTADVIKCMAYYSEDAVELIMMTAAQESHCGSYIVQVSGPALGIFQMEPATHDDIWNNYLRYRKGVAEKVIQFASLRATEHGNGKYLMDLKANIPYGIALARVHYLRCKGALPPAEDWEAMARYYKAHWNTYAGKATVEEAIENYKRYALETEV